MENSYEFKMSFKGEKIINSLNAKDVGNAILSLSTILDEVAKQTLDKDFAENFEIRVQGFEKGSFVTDLQLLIDPEFLKAIGSTLPFLGANSLKGILDNTKAYFEIKKFLKGEPPKEIKEDGNNGSIIESHFGDKMQVSAPVIHLINNGTMNIGAENLMKSLLHNPDAEKLSLIDSKTNEPITSVSEDEAEYFENVFTDEELKEITPVIETHQITIVKIAFEEHLKSTFSILGKKFNSKIEDKEFWAKNPKIGKGDTFMAKIEILSDGQKSQYRILQIIEHISAPEQLSTNNI